MQFVVTMVDDASLSKLQRCTDVMQVRKTSIRTISSSSLSRVVLLVVDAETRRNCSNQEK